MTMNDDAISGTVRCSPFRGSEFYIVNCFLGGQFFGCNAYSVPPLGDCDGAGRSLTQEMSGILSARNRDVFAAHGPFSCRCFGLRGVDFVRCGKSSGLKIETSAPAFARQTHLQGNPPGYCRGSDLKEQI